MIPLKIYATHLFMPTELHSGNDGPSMVQISTPGGARSLLHTFAINLTEINASFLNMRPICSPNFCPFGADRLVATEIGSQYLHKNYSNARAHQELLNENDVQLTRVRKML